MKLSVDRFKAHEYEFNIWVATPEAKQTLDDLSEPSYWAHVASKMRPWDVVIARADDGAWFAVLLVLACDRQWAKVHILSEHNLTTADLSQSQNDAYQVKWQGPHAKFAVIRNSDKTVLKNGFQLRDDADLWVREHNKAMAT